MSFEKPAVVIDNGSYNIKAGFSCDNHPVSMFRNIVGRPRSLQGSYGREYYDVHIGDEAVEMVEDLDLNHPVVNGRIVHWDNMERIWHHIFYKELKVAPEDRAVILACSSMTSIEEKIKCCEVIFETLNAPALCVQSQSVLALYGSGFTTGICVDLGHDTTDINPVFEGGVINYAHMRSGLAGEQISSFIKQCLLERDLDFGIKSLEIIERIKKNCLYVTQNCAMPIKESKRSCKLPDGVEVNVCNEAFMAAELLFQPRVVKKGSNYMPLHEAVVTSALKCDSELRSEMYDAIVPCGGLSMIPGLNERLATEIKVVANRSVSVISSPEAYAVAWLGGATFAGLPDSKKMWVMKKQFEDHGERIVRNKFL